VALLRLAHDCAQLDCRVLHFNHQARGRESDDDAAFVEQLAASLHLPCDVVTRQVVEASTKTLPKNRSARFRALRLAWFASVVQRHDLTGVLLGHHADDQAETILLRLLRGPGYRGLAGMSTRSKIGALLLYRPLLHVRRRQLREYLHDIRQRWREDSSNESTAYLRNRIRPVLAGNEPIVKSLLEVGAACRGLRLWTRRAAPELHESFAASELANLPAPLAEEAARRWLIARGVSSQLIRPGNVIQLIEMASDAASPPRVDFPGAVRVHRRAGKIFT
jgi:tRNA(Ile)-lysidine synthase